MLSQGRRLISLGLQHAAALDCCLGITFWANFDEDFFWFPGRFKVKVSRVWPTTSSPEIQNCNWHPHGAAQAPLTFECLASFRNRLHGVFEKIALCSSRQMGLRPLSSFFCVFCFSPPRRVLHGTAEPRLQHATLLTLVKHSSEMLQSKGKIGSGKHVALTSHPLLFDHSRVLCFLLDALFSC